METTAPFAGFATLKRTVSLTQVLDRYGLLERLRRSGDQLNGACPLHGGHNPSQFRADLDRNLWICFGDCHQGGSIIDFVSAKERVGIREAARLIQDWFGVLPGRTTAEPRPEPPPVNGHNPPLQYGLGPLDNAHPYLKERGLQPGTIATFGIGFCSRGWLSGWIVLPIHDAQGQLVAYAARYPGEPPDDCPKYRLPRGFRKSLELYNQHRAAAEPADQPLVVVEGYFAALHCWQAGLRKVVSTMGSMVSHRQAELIVESVRGGSVILAFDEDPAGRQGRRQVWERLHRQVPVSVLRFPEQGMQPDHLAPADLIDLVRSAERRP
jgi:DNA primase